MVSLKRKRFEANDTTFRPCFEARLGMFRIKNCMNWENLNIEHKHIQTMF